jgi:hypothetical protein
MQARLDIESAVSQMFGVTSMAGPLSAN